MMTAIDLPTLALIVSFLVYGTRCFFAEEMVREFQRWGVARLRYITGSLEVLGALGLIVGQWIPWIGFFAAGGLSSLMLCGLFVRIRIRDSFLQTLPAVVYLVVSVIVAYGFVQYL
jgi:uncharacterized membrane protein